MTSKKSSKERKIFLNCMNSWLSNFIIEEFRTDYIPDSKIKNVFMGTLDLSGRPLPALFEPKITTVEIGFNYNQELFQNDIFIYNLDDSNLSEVEFVIRGLQKIKYDNEKILILISNIMTWGKTPVKTFTDEEINKEGFNEEEVPEIEEEIKEEIIEKEEEHKENEEEKKSEESKVNEKLNLEIVDNKEKKNKRKFDKNKIGLKEDKNDNKKIEEDKEKFSTIKSEQNSEENNKNNNEVNNNIENQFIKKEKPKIRTFYYKESEFNKRIPNSKFFYYKLLESLALSNINPNLKAYIICPGLIYGCGEDIFFDYFRAAWKGELEYMPLIGECENHIPTIHVLDLIHTIKRVINLKPDINYIFACDKTKNPSMRNILNCISKGIGGIESKVINDFNLNNINMPHYAELSIDLRIKSSPIMEDEPRRPKEDKEDYEERKFQWHCEYGIPENIDILREEFNLYRDLKPIKIIITGPPYGGKSTIAKMISEKYKIIHLTIDKICDWAKNEKGELGEEVKKQNEEIEENLKKAMEEYEHKKKKKTDPPFDPSLFNKYPDDFLAKIIKKRLSVGECVSKGYILENYPKSYNDCISLYSENNLENKEGNINKDLLPDSVLIINNYTEESLKEKLKLKYNDYSERVNELDNKFKRRLGKYKQLEEINDENKKLLTEFYKENNIDLFFIEEQNIIPNSEEENKKIIEFLERNGPIDNEYKLFDEEEIKIFEAEKENIKEEKQENQEEEKEKEKEKEDKSNFEEEKANSKEVKDDNNNNNEEEEKSNIEEKKITKIEESKNNEIDIIQLKIDEQKERETTLLEKKTEILRRYLSENVIPLLSKGILNICQNLPEDPVESLAKYLADSEFQNNIENDEKKKTENELIKMVNETMNE